MKILKNYLICYGIFLCIKGILCSLTGVCHVLGAEQTDKFTFDILCGNASCSPGRKYAVAVVLSGQGRTCGKASKQGDRFFICDETPVICGDTSFKVAICR